MRAHASEWVARATLALVGLVVAIMSIGYGIRTDEGLVGPGMVPFVAGALMLLASLWDGALALRRRPADLDTPTADAGAADTSVVDHEEPEASPRKVFLVFVVLVATIALSHLLGLLLALALMVFVLIWGIERRTWWSAALGALIAVAFGYLVFEKALQVPLPTGLLGLI